MAAVLQGSFSWTFEPPKLCLTGGIHTRTVSIFMFQLGVLQSCCGMTGAAKSQEANWGTRIGRYWEAQASTARTSVPSLALTICSAGSLL